MRTPILIRIVACLVLSLSLMGIGSTIGVQAKSGLDSPAQGQTEEPPTDTIAETPIPTLTSTDILVETAPPTLTDTDIPDVSPTLSFTPPAPDTLTNTPTDIPTETVTLTLTGTDFFDVFVTPEITLPATDTPTPTSTPTPVFHDVEITAFFVPIHRPERAGAVPLRANHVGTITAVVNVQSNSSHFLERDTVNVSVSVTGTAANCGAVPAVQNDQINLNPGQSKPVIFRLHLLCTVGGVIPNAVTLRAQATHLGAPDANPADNVVNYAINVIVR